MKPIAVIGASGGLGGAVVRRIAGKHSLLLGYRSNRDAVEALAAEVGAAGVRQVDIRDPASVAAFLDCPGGLGGVVSMSGAPFPMCALTDASEAEFRDVIETEMFGTFNILKAAVPRLEAAGGGPIVLCLTTAVLRTMDFDGLNSVPKAAIAMMLRHVAREAGPRNVRCNGIAPGVIDAGRTDIVATLPPLVQQVVSDCVAATPMPRLGRPEEVGALVDYLLSDAAAYVNGQIIAVDGGYSA